VENSYELWAGMARSEVTTLIKRIQCAPKPLYTNVGESSRKNGTAKAFQGWTMEGYQGFDELYNAGKADRMAEGREYYKETLKALVAQDNTTERPSR
jgi:hypothetical protein